MTTYDLRPVQALTGMLEKRGVLNPIEPKPARGTDGESGVF